MHHKTQYVHTQYVLVGP